ncbi:MAG: YheU family protein [Marinobacterium sp.]|nr:YheU family protein [Marinobacterium sp.]
MEEYSELMHCVEVPWQQLSAQALDGLIDEFVTRDGTDYGEQEMSTQARNQQVRELLAQNRAVILFSHESGQCNIVAREKLA